MFKRKESLEEKYEIRFANALEGLRSALQGLEQRLESLQNTTAAINAAWTVSSVIVDKVSVKLESLLRKRKRKAKRKK